MTKKSPTVWLAITLLFSTLAACTPPRHALAQAEAPAAEALPATAVPSQAFTPPASTPDAALSYPVVDSSQGKCYDDYREIPCPASSSIFFGQDAQYAGALPDYTNHQNGTITDNVTRLTWQQSPDTNGDDRLDAQDKLTWQQAQTLPAKLNVARYGNYTDWRLPTIKELYSLILFDGSDVSFCPGGQCNVTPFIHTRYFNFAYGNAADGERTIDSQYLSSTRYVSQGGQAGDKVFGVNFADGRIKGYDLNLPGGTQKTFFVLCVRGNPEYGVNDFVDNGDQTITDRATGLTWAKADSSVTLNWQQALAWVQQQNAANYLGHTDWRLPDAKELQSIVDYTRSPDATQSAAIDAMFTATPIKNEAGQVDYPAYWTGTTHVAANGSGENAVYISFGRAMGNMHTAWIDVHGAGAQRSDPKSGDPARFSSGRGPQGDAVHIDNYVRLVRGGRVTFLPDGAASASRPSQAVQSTALQPNRPVPSETMGVPPPEALQACAASSAGAVCQFNAPHGTVYGTCQSKPHNLVCVPSNP